MSNSNYLYKSQVCLPVPLPELLEEWNEVRKLMIRKMNSDFTRHEWAYLISFLDPKELENVFNRELCSDQDLLFRPVSKVALWLPNNVSLLGPLTFILLSLVAPELRVKLGSRGKNLLGSFTNWIVENTQGRILKEWIKEKVQIANFDRTDPRNAEMAGWAERRILFGGNSAAEAIESLPHPLGSKAFYFTDKVSEAWVEPSCITKENVVKLGKVFSIYGQAGCTSPKRVLIPGGTKEDAMKIVNLFKSHWREIQINPAELFTASELIMSSQINNFSGIDQGIIGSNEALISIIKKGEIPYPSNSSLVLYPISESEILESQASNLQTIGHVLEEPENEKWKAIFTKSPATRFVSVESMHHFSPRWDGISWWRELFTIQEWKTNT